MAIYTLRELIRRGRALQVRRQQAGPEEEEKIGLAELLGESKVEEPPVTGQEEQVVQAAASAEETRRAPDAVPIGELLPGFPSPAMEPKPGPGIPEETGQSFAASLGEAIMTSTGRYATDREMLTVRDYPKRLERIEQTLRERAEEGRPWYEILAEQERKSLWPVLTEQRRGKGPVEIVEIKPETYPTYESYKRELLDSLRLYPHKYATRGHVTWRDVSKDTWWYARPFAYLFRNLARYSTKIPWEQTVQWNPFAGHMELYSTGKDLVDLLRYQERTGEVDPVALQHAVDRYKRAQEEEAGRMPKSAIGRAARSAAASTGLMARAWAESLPGGPTGSLNPLASFDTFAVMGFADMFQRLADEYGPQVFEQISGDDFSKLLDIGRRRAAIYGAVEFSNTPISVMASMGLPVGRLGSRLMGTILRNSKLLQQSGVSGKVLRFLTLAAARYVPSVLSEAAEEGMQEAAVRTALNRMREVVNRYVPPAERHSAERAIDIWAASLRETVESLPSVAMMVAGGDPEAFRSALSLSPYDNIRHARYEDMYRRAKELAPLIPDEWLEAYYDVPPVSREILGELVRTDETAAKYITEREKGRPSEVVWAEIVQSEKKRGVHEERVEEERTQHEKRLDDMIRRGPDGIPPPPVELGKVAEPEPSPAEATPKEESREPAAPVPGAPVPTEAPTAVAPADLVARAAERLGVSVEEAREIPFGTLNRIVTDDQFARQAKEQISRVQEAEERERGQALKMDTAEAKVDAIATLESLAPVIEPKPSTEEARHAEGAGASAEAGSPPTAETRQAQTEAGRAMEIGRSEVRLRSDEETRLEAQPPEGTRAVEPEKGEERHERHEETRVVERRAVQEPVAAPAVAGREEPVSPGRLDRTAEVREGAVPARGTEGAVEEAPPKGELEAERVAPERGREETAKEERRMPSRRKRKGEMVEKKQQSPPEAVTREERVVEPVAEVQPEQVPVAVEPKKEEPAVVAAQPTAEETKETTREEEKQRAEAEPAPETRPLTDESKVVAVERQMAELIKAEAERLRPFFAETGEIHQAAREHEVIDKEIAKLQGVLRNLEKRQDGVRRARTKAERKAQDAIREEIDGVERQIRKLRARDHDLYQSYLAVANFRDMQDERIPVWKRLQYLGTVLDAVPSATAKKTLDQVNKRIVELTRELFRQLLPDATEKELSRLVENVSPIHIPEDTTAELASRLRERLTVFRREPIDNALAKAGGKWGTQGQAEVAGEVVMFKEAPLTKEMVGNLSSHEVEEVVETINQLAAKKQETETRKAEKRYHSLYQPEKMPDPAAGSYEFAAQWTPPFRGATPPTKAALSLPLPSALVKKRLVSVKDHVAIFATEAGQVIWRTSLPNGVYEVLKNGQFVRDDSSDMDALSYWSSPAKEERVNVPIRDARLFWAALSWKPAEAIYLYKESDDTLVVISVGDTEKRKTDRLFVLCERISADLSRLPAKWAVRFKDTEPTQRLLTVDRHSPTPVLRVGKETVVVDTGNLELLAFVEPRDDTSGIAEAVRKIDNGEVKKESPPSIPAAPDTTPEPILWRPRPVKRGKATPEEVVDSHVQRLLREQRSAEGFYASVKGGKAVIFVPMSDSVIEQPSRREEGVYTVNLAADKPIWREAKSVPAQVERLREILFDKGEVSVVLRGESLRKFKDAVRAVKDAVDTKLARRVLTGVLLEFDGKELSIVGTDGRRIHWATLAAEGQGGGKMWLSDEVTEGILALRDEEEVRLLGAGGKGGLRTKVSLGDRSITERAPGDYPNWRGVLPREDDHLFRFSLPRADVLTALERLRPYLMELEPYVYPTICCVTERHLYLYPYLKRETTDELSSEAFRQRVVSAKVPLEDFHGAKDALPFYFVINSDYLSDALEAAEGDKVQVTLWGDDKPIEVKSGNKQAVVALVRKTGLFDIELRREQKATGFKAEPPDLELIKKRFTDAVSEIGGTVEEAGDALRASLGKHRVTVTFVRGLETARGINLLQHTGPEGSAEWVIQIDTEKADLSTPVHELLHSVWDLLSGEERDSLAGLFGLDAKSDTEEIIERLVVRLAEEEGKQVRGLQAVWEKVRPILSALLHLRFGEAWQKIKRLPKELRAAKVLETIRSGRVFERPLVHQTDVLVERQQAKKRSSRFRSPKLTPEQKAAVPSVVEHVAHLPYKGRYGTLLQLVRGVFGMGRAAASPLVVEDAIARSFDQMAREMEKKRGGRQRRIDMLVDLASGLDELEAEVNSLPADERPEYLRRILVNFFGPSRFLAMRRATRADVEATLTAVRKWLGQEIKHVLSRELDAWFGGAIRRRHDKTGRIVERVSRGINEDYDLAADEAAQWKALRKRATAKSWADQDWREVLATYIEARRILASSRAKLEAFGEDRRLVQRQLAEIVASEIEEAREPFRQPGEVPRREPITKRFPRGSIMSYAYALSPAPDSVINSLLDNETLRCSRAECRIRARVHREWTEKLRQLGLTERDIIRWQRQLVTVTLPSGRQQQWRVDEIMGLYAAMQDAGGLPDKLLANGFVSSSLRERMSERIDVSTEPDMQAAVAAIVGNLTEQQKAVADFIVEQMTGLGVDIDDVMETLTGRRVCSSPRYYTAAGAVIRETTEPEVDPTRLFSDPEAYVTRAMENLDPRWTRPRTPHKHAFMIRPIFLVRERFIGEAATFVGWAYWFNMMRQLLRDARVREAIVDRHGLPMIQALEESVFYMAHIREEEVPPGAQRGALIRTMQKLQRRISSSTMWMRLGPIIKNRILGVVQLGAAVWRWNPKAALALWFKPRLPLIKRALTKEVEADLLSDPSLYNRWKIMPSAIFLQTPSRFSEEETAGLRSYLSRRIARVGLVGQIRAEMANAAELYQVLRRLGYEKERALELVDRATRDSQNPGTQRERTMAYRQSQAWGMGQILPFLGQMSVMQDWLRREVRRTVWAIRHASGSDRRRALGELLVAVTVTVFNVLLEHLFISEVLRRARAGLLVGGAAMEEDAKKKKEEAVARSRLIGIVGDMVGVAGDPVLGRAVRVGWDSVSFIVGASREPSLADETLIMSSANKILRGLRGLVRETGPDVPEADARRIADSAVSVVEGLSDFLGGPLGGPADIYRLASGVALPPPVEQTPARRRQTEERTTAEQPEKAERQISLLAVEHGRAIESRRIAPRQPVRRMPYRRLPARGRE